MKGINEKISYTAACDLGDTGQFVLIHIDWFPRVKKKHPDCSHLIYPEDANWKNPDTRYALVLAEENQDRW